MKLPRMYGILDTALLSMRGVGVVAAAEALLDGGIRMLQLREKRHFSRDVFAQAEDVARLCRQAGAIFVINDRADAAMLLDAGLHVGQDDLPPADARRLIGPSRLLGFSTHNEAQLRAGAGEPVDYVALGPIFTTRTKHKPDPEVGLAELRRLRPLISLPLVAIGGITRETAPEVWRAGADTIAVVADLYPEQADGTSIRQRAEEWMRIAAG
jgi:thiamine-phosphate pyrophosphorylase